MTRKRFKKLCMGCYIERDMAELMANLALALVGDYREALRGGLLEALEEAERAAKERRAAEDPQSPQDAAPYEETEARE